MSNQNSFVGPPDLRVTKPEPSKFFPPQAQNPMDQALAAPVHQGGGFDLNRIAQQMLFTGGGRHTETNTDGTMKQFDQPSGIDWVKQHTASPEEMQMRQARMQAEKTGPAWSPTDNAAEFNKLLNASKGPQFQTRENAQGGTMRMAMDPQGRVVGSSTEGPGFEKMGGHLPPQRLAPGGAMHEGYSLKDGPMLQSEHQQLRQAINKDANLFGRLYPQGTHADAMAHMPTPQITAPPRQYVNSSHGRDRSALGLGPSQADMNVSGGMPEGIATSGVTEKTHPPGRFDWSFGLGDTPKLQTQSGFLPPTAPTFVAENDLAPQQQGNVTVYPKGYKPKMKLQGSPAGNFFDALKPFGNWLIKGVQ